MEELEISGKRYISTRRAAKEHGYHSDYMGQLIRGGKVAGQKVGRAWYIDELSLATYLSGEQKPAEPVVVVTAAPEPTPAPKEIVQEVPKSEPVVIEETKAPEVIEEKIVIKKQIVPEPEELFVEQKSTRVPIYTATPIGEMGGLRYAADNSPSIPTVVRMPQPGGYTRVPAAPIYAEQVASRRTFPIISLSVVALCALLAAAFVSNFVSTTIVSEPGKSASVGYIVHW